MSAFTVSSDGPDEAGTWRVIASGEVDLVTADDLRRETESVLANEGVSGLVIDLADVTFIDSMGLGALVAIRNLTHGRGLDLQLANVPDNAYRILAITGLAEVFGVVGPEDREPPP